MVSNRATLTLRTPRSIERLLNSYQIDPIRELAEIAVSLRGDSSPAGLDLRFRVNAALAEFVHPRQINNILQGPLAGPVRVKEWTGLVARPPGRPGSVDPLEAQERIVEREQPGTTQSEPV